MIVQINRNTWGVRRIDVFKFFSVISSFKKVKNNITKI